MWLRVFNKGAHLAIGMVAGWNAEKPIAPMATAAFIAYQAIEVASKGDKGYPEVKEFGVGLAIGAVAKRLWRSRRPR